MGDYRIIVDAGHGGEDPGAVSGNLQEKDFNLRAANYMYNRFRELGVPVAITRDSDITLTRDERLDIMNNTFGTDPNVIILANHINAGGGEGAEVVYPLRSTDVLARNILEAIGEEGQIMRKYYQRRLPENPSKDYYYIMRETPNTTSLLIEYGFIDNANDQTKLNNYLLDYVEAVVRAVANYIGVPYVAPDNDLENTYTVKAGDTLYGIARRFNITVDRLKALNNLTNNNLSIGQVLIISEEVNIPPQPSEGITYTVKAGDTLYKIANQYNVSVADIISLNNLGTTVLTIGQQLLIPNTDVDIDTTTTYTVQSGDSLYKIANQFGVTVNDIISSNNLNSTVLQIGQILTIPTAGETIPTPPQEESDYFNYTVKSGDSLYQIANRYNTTVDAIKNINNLTSNNLSIGQTLKIPTQTNYINYYVKRGDSLYQIANRYNTTVDAIKKLNNLTSNTLSIGQLLLIPR